MPKKAKPKAGKTFLNIIPKEATPESAVKKPSVPSQEEIS